MQIVLTSHWKKGSTLKKEKEKEKRICSISEQILSILEGPNVLFFFFF